jgi:KDO2-lipid IV(A) lauroyltransferase
MVKSLKKGRVVWYAPDQDFGRQGSVFVPFFHQPAATLTTVGKLLKMTNAKPLFYSHFRIEENGQTVYLARIHDPFHDGFNDDDIHNATLLNQAIADVIREHPEQYLWVHERFRTQPQAGMPKPYTIRKDKKKPMDL